VTKRYKLCFQIIQESRTVDHALKYFMQAILQLFLNIYDSLKKVEGILDITDSEAPSKTSRIAETMLVKSITSNSY
jgi:hypothetical protein